MFPYVGSTDMGAFEVSYGGEMFPVMVGNIDGGVWVEMGERMIWEGRE